MKVSQRFTVLTVTAVMVAAVGGISPAQAAPVAAKAGTVSGVAKLSAEVARNVQGSGVEAEHRALTAYWNPARMKAARPDTEMPVMKAAAGSARKAAQAPPGAGRQGTPQKIAAAPPKAAPQAGPVGPSTQAYDPAYPVGHPVARTVGKVFFTSFGVNYVCSASIVNSEGRSTVWTAGHCLSSGAAWNYNWTFVPNYVNGSAPYGYWYSSNLTTTTAWFYNNNDYANDVGAAVMTSNNGVRIADYLGGQGIAWNQPVGGYVYAYGYPQGSPFNGCCLYAEEGYTYDGGGGTVYMVNYMTGGSSGGPWLGWFDGNWGYVNGHNDFKYNAYPEYMFSPYYGNQVADVYNAVRYASA